MNEKCSLFYLVLRSFVATCFYSRIISGEGHIMGWTRAWLYSFDTLIVHLKYFSLICRLVIVDKFKTMHFSIVAREAFASDTRVERYTPKRLPVSTKWLILRKRRAVTHTALEKLGKHGCASVNCKSVTVPVIVPPCMHCNSRLGGKHVRIMTRKYWSVSPLTA